jgi:indole-3-glycerol phosphate synthase
VSVLNSIIEGVRQDEQLRRIDRSRLLEMIASAPKPISSIDRLSKGGLSLIAEVKRSSPSKGDLSSIPNPALLAETYTNAGAAVISVLTEERRFKGSLADFTAVRQSIDIPMLRKDFMVSEYLIEESRAFGADLVLLIVAALDDVQLRDFYDLATELGMSSLVEIHDEVELERALAINPKIVGVNARNLKTLEVEQEAFRKLLPLIPKSIVKVAESGMSSKQDAQFARNHGADAILVGEALVKAINPAELISDFLACEIQK